MKKYTLLLICFFFAHFLFGQEINLKDLFREIVLDINIKIANILLPPNVQKCDPNFKSSNDLLNCLKKNVGESSNTYKLCKQIKELAFNKNEITRDNFWLELKQLQTIISNDQKLTTKEKTIIDSLFQTYSPSSMNDIWKRSLEEVGVLGPEEPSIDYYQKFNNEKDRIVAKYSINKELESKLFDAYHQEFQVMLKKEVPTQNQDDFLKNMISEITIKLQTDYISKDSIIYIVNSFNETNDYFNSPEKIKNEAWDKSFGNKLASNELISKQEFDEIFSNYKKYTKSKQLNRSSIIGILIIILILSLILNVYLFLNRKRISQPLSSESTPVNSTVTESNDENIRKKYAEIKKEQHKKYSLSEENIKYLFSESDKEIEQYFVKKSRLNLYELSNWTNEMSSFLINLPQRISQKIKNESISQKSFEDELLRYNNEFIKQYNKLDPDEINEVFHEYYSVISNLYQSSNLILKEQYVKEISTIIKRIEEKLETLASEVEQKDEIKPIDNIFYTSFPDPDGYFWDDKKTKSSEYNSAFVLNIINNGQNAKFEFYTEGQMELSAVSSWKVYLLPICLIMSKVESPKRLKQEGYGMLNYNNGKWVVDNNMKLKIKLLD